MRISTQTGSLPETFGIEKSFSMMREAGIEAVDFNIDHMLPYRQILQGEKSGFFTQSDREMTQALRPYKEAARKNGIAFAQAHAPFPNYTGSEDRDAFVRHAVKKCIMLMHDLECPNLIVHPGIQTFENTPENEWAYNRDMYADFIPDLKKYGVCCCLENMFTSRRGKIFAATLSDPSEAVQYVDTLNEMAGEEVFGFCLDTGHLLVCSMDAYTWLKRLNKRVKALHIHDNDGIDDEHLFPYQGIADWDRFCCGLQEIHYDGDLNFETFGTFSVNDPALAPDLLRLLGSIGRLFRTKITQKA